jgi:hypothetical protein
MRASSRRVWALPLSALVSLNLLSACTHGERGTSLPWGIRSSSPSARELELIVTEGGCTTFDHFESDEGAETVTVTAVGIAPEPSPSVFCTADLRRNVHTLMLKHPLGDRRLLPAPISPSWKNVPRGASTTESKQGVSVLLRRGASAA